MLRVFFSPGAIMEVIVFAMVSLALVIAIMGLVMLFRVPDAAWRRLDQTRTLWVLLVILTGPFAVAVYAAALHPRLVQADRIMKQERSERFLQEIDRALADETDATGSR